MIVSVIIFSYNRGAGESNLTSADWSSRRAVHISYLHCVHLPCVGGLSQIVRHSHHYTGTTFFNVFEKAYSEKLCEKDRLRALIPHLYFPQFSRDVNAF